MKTKVNEATGVVLDWMVAKVEGLTPTLHKNPSGCWVMPNIPGSYSADWKYGGPIIEREGIDLNWSNHEGASGEMWDAACEAERIFGGPTPLIAAMRCFCASRLGDEIDVPEELL